MSLPASFLVIPFVHLMHRYGLTDSLWAVIAAEVTFATPYAILILHQYGKLIPIELDEAAKIDGASPVQVYLRIYLPLMAPALVAVGVYALLLAWNEYLYQFLLLSSPRSMTVAVAIDQFFDSDEAPWNYMMAIAIDLFAAADRDLFRAAPVHGGRTDADAIGSIAGAALRDCAATRGRWTRSSCRRAACRGTILRPSTVRPPGIDTASASP